MAFTSSSVTPIGLTESGLGAQLVADSALQLASTGTLTPDSGDVIRSRAEELYSRGLVRAFADPLEVLRRRTLYDGMLGVVIGSDSALASLREASAD